MELIVEPPDGRVDVVPRLLVTGASEPVRLEIVTTDAAGTAGDRRAPVR